MSLETEVLVIGAGPVGLALAGDLGWRGRRCIVVERGDGSIDQPRMDLVGIRTMEYCRRWGIIGDVEASAYDRDYPQDNVYLTALNGYELGRQPMPSMREERAPAESPQHRERCPQNMFDPILRKFAQTQDGNTFLYRHELISFEQGEHDVTAKVLERDTGNVKVIRAQYLVGCDGGRSTVRTQLGIDMQGRGILTHSTNIIFRCPEFNQLHDKQPGYRYMFVGPVGTWATIVAINGKDQWRMSIIGNATERPEYTHEQIRAFAYRAVGREFDMEILSVLPWTRMELVADHYHAGRAFLCGDACHLTSPTGGLGMNTGIGDAVTLSWKLQALIEGWGGAQLSEAYTIERRPIAKRITAFSSHNLQTMRRIPTSEKLYEDSKEGRQARELAGAALMEGLKQEWFSMNIHLGNRYTDSPIIVYSEPESRDAIEAEYNDAIHYRPTSRPGCRAPHVGLESEVSTLDLFGRGFVLLTFAPEKPTAEPVSEAAARLDIPLTVVSLSDPKAAALYAKRFVLVRPDGHVAWRADAMPNDISSILKTVTGRRTQ